MTRLGMWPGVRPGTPPPAPWGTADHDSPCSTTPSTAATIFPSGAMPDGRVPSHETEVCARLHYVYGARSHVCSRRSSLTPVAGQPAFLTGQTTSGPTNCPHTKDAYGMCRHASDPELCLPRPVFSHFGPWQARKWVQTEPKMSVFKGDPDPRCLF